MEAHACPNRRSEMQVAVSRMAMIVLRDAGVKPDRYKGAAKRELADPETVL